LPNGMADYIAAVNRENTREFASEQFPEVFKQS